MRFVVRLLANLTDPAAKGFEDRVIRVLESLVPATSNQAVSNAALPTPAASDADASSHSGANSAVSATKS